MPAYRAVDNAAEVKSLAGIEYFRNLKTLKVSGLESLDDTNLAVGNINLTSVDISLVKGLTAVRHPLGRHGHGGGRGRRERGGRADT